MQRGSAQALTVMLRPSPWSSAAMHKWRACHGDGPSQMRTSERASESSCSNRPCARERPPPWLVVGASHVLAQCISCGLLVRPRRLVVGLHGLWRWWRWFVRTAGRCWRESLLLFAVVVCSPNNNNSSDNALGDDDDAHLCVRAQCVLAAAIPRWFICSAIFSVMVGTHRLWAGTVFERCCLHGHCCVCSHDDDDDDGLRCCHRRFCVQISCTCCLRGARVFALQAALIITVVVVVVVSLATDHRWRGRRRRCDPPTRCCCRCYFRCSRCC